MSSRPLLLGHRGARAEKRIRENTIASFDRALADGCDGFEFDVRVTADAKLVICHDPQSEGVEIAQASAQQLAGLPQLQDVLTRYQDRAFLDIELKVSGLEKIAVDLLRQHPPGHGFMVSSFLPEVLQAVREEDSRIALGLICESKAQLRRWQEISIEYLIPHQALTDQQLIRQAHSEDKKVLVWTVNSDADMQRYAGWGVDGIISDDTKLLGETVRG